MKAAGNLIIIIVRPVEPVHLAQTGHVRRILTGSGLELVSRTGLENVDAEPEPELKPELPADPFLRPGLMTPAGFGSEPSVRLMEVRGQPQVPAAVVEFPASRWRASTDHSRSLAVTFLLAAAPRLGQSFKHPLQPQ